MPAYLNTHTRHQAVVIDKARVDGRLTASSSRVVAGDIHTTQTKTMDSHMSTSSYK